MEVGEETRARPRGVSRRQLLKRAGAGAALLYSAPVLTSAASADHGGRHVCFRNECSRVDDPCSFRPACNPPPTAPSRCSCYPNQRGKCVCREDEGVSACECFPTCARDAECPVDWKCVVVCCPGGPGSENVNRCMPPCGTIVTECPVT